MASPGPTDNAPGGDRRGGRDNRQNNYRDSRDGGRGGRGGYSRGGGGRDGGRDGGRERRGSNEYRDRNRAPRSRSPNRSDRRESNRQRSPPRGGGQRASNGRGEYRNGDRGGRSPTDDRHNQPSRVPTGPRSNGASTTAAKVKTETDTAPISVKPTTEMRDESPMDEDDDEAEERAMQKMMGFKGFKSTKNKKVPGNDKNFAIRKDKQTQYRQYMNRVGGFNRPLSPSQM